MNKKIMLWFDVEDYVTPEAEDTLFELLKMLDEFGVRATLKLCTMKYEQLVAHGRRDILRLMHNHELAFHTTDHSFHPLPSEYLDNLGFADGAAAFEKKEKAGMLSLRDLSGQTLTSYGQPGEAWAPQVFPFLCKWGIQTYLDGHDILRVDGQPFWFGGVLCLTKLNNLSHLKKDGSTDSMIQLYKHMDLTCDKTVFFSIYDHPHELCNEEFWDEVNFPDGKNPPYLVPAKLRPIKERDGYLRQYREFLEYTRKDPDAEYITALESMRYEILRTEPITGEMLKDSIISNDASYVKIGASYVTAAEMLGLMARHLTGRLLTPEFQFGPEIEAKSVCAGEISAKELAEAVYQNSNFVLGYKQLPDLYRVGDAFISPLDAFATLAEAIRTGKETLPLVHGRLAAADHVKRDVHQCSTWPLWKEDFTAENIIHQTALQCWTLKPALF